MSYGHWSRTSPDGGQRIAVLGAWEPGPQPFRTSSQLLKLCGRTRSQQTTVCCTRDACLPRSIRRPMWSGWARALGIGSCRAATYREFSGNMSVGRVKCERHRSACDSCSLCVLGVLTLRRGIRRSTMIALSGIPLLYCGVAALLFFVLITSGHITT